MKHQESTLQANCVKWFRLQYPKCANVLFAIPNGGARTPIQGAILKREGVLAGVADLFLAIPTNTAHGLFIEMKIGKGKQSEAQKIFEGEISRNYDYKIIRTFDEFKELIESYLIPTT